MQIESYCEAKKVLQLQELVKQFNLRWIFNPYLVIANQPYGKWKVGIDYNNVGNEQARLLGNVLKHRLMKALKTIQQVTNLKFGLNNFW